MIDNYDFLPKRYIDEIYTPIISIGDDIKDYYVISNYGTIINYKLMHEIIPHENKNGYMQVSLMTETGRVFRKVHRLLMMSFFYFEGCENFQVNHKNGNKKINEYWNLEWVTPKENINHAIEYELRKPFKGEDNPQALITEEQAKIIIEMLKRKIPDQEIANAVCFGNISIVRCIAYGNTWSYLISEEDMNIIRSDRKGNYIPYEIKCGICNFYQNNSYNYSGYGSSTKLIKDALIYNNLDPNNKTLFRIAKRLFYRHQDDDITSKYFY